MSSYLTNRRKFRLISFAILAVPALAVLEIMVRILVSVRKQKALLCQVSIFYGGVVRKTTGLWDTGNSLKDPLHNKPVSIVERRVLEPEVSGEELLFQIPYHSLGNTNGMLPALIADYLTIQLGDRTYVAERPVLGLTEEPLSGDSSYNLILNPNLVDS